MNKRIIKYPLNFVLFAGGNTAGQRVKRMPLLVKLSLTQLNLINLDNAGTLSLETTVEALSVQIVMKAAGRYGGERHF